MTRSRDLRHWLPVGTGWVIKLCLIAAYLAGAVPVWRSQAKIVAYAETVELISLVMKALMTHIFPAYLLAGGGLLAVLLLYPFGRKMAQDQLESIGLVNHTGAVPILLRRYRDREHPRVVIWAFQNQSIPLSDWGDRRGAIETALDITIVQIRYGRGKNRVLLYAVPARTDLPEVIPWKDRYLSPDSFVLVLGESLLGPVTINLDRTPHILLGGSTGSGKSVLLKLLLMQALQMGAEVCIADFKGGVDFPPIWHEKCRMCFEEQELLDLLTELTAELQRRKGLLKARGCSNLDDYNRAAGGHLRRIIFACDEVAEVLDRTGADKARKEVLAQIEARLSVIARQGWAFGIHLILATQRPDAAIIPGQIRSNLDCRICGRADSVLSQIILDSTGAAEVIPKNARGRFLLHDGTVFQSYLFDEGSLHLGVSA